MLTFVWKIQIKDIGYGAVEIHENKILPENLQELHVDHIFKVASEGVDRPTQGNSDFVVIFFFIFETRVLLKEVEECLPLIGRTRWLRQ